MTDLVVIVPSRGRPAAALELARVFVETATGNTEMTFAVDESDPTRDEYSRVPHAVSGAVSVGLMPSTNMAEALNGLAVFIAENPTAFGDPFAIGFMGDDHRPRTVGWDRAYVDALREMGSGLVFGNDLIQGPRLPTQIAMTSDIVRALGYMAPPDMTHLYLDNFWRDLGRETGRIRYLADVVIEHVHPITGKVPWDEGHLRVNQQAQYDRDREAYSAYLRSGQFTSDLDKVRAL